MATNPNDPNVNININAQNQTDQATQQVNSNLDSIAAAAGKIAIGAAIIAGIKALGDSIRSYINDAAGAERTANKLYETLNKNSGGTQEQTDALIEQAGALLTLTGYSDDATVAAQTQLAAFKLNANQIAELTPLVLDTAEAMRKMGQTDMDLGQVAGIVAQAIDGKEKSLKKLGVTLTPVQSETLKLGNQQERLKVITDALSDSFGGLAEKMGDKFEASLRRLDESAGNLDETIGGLVTGNEDAKNAVDSMSDSYDAFGALITENAGVIGEGISLTVAGIIEAVNLVKGVFNEAQILAGGATLAIIESFRLISVGMAKVTFGDVSQKWQDNADEFQGVSNSLKEGIKKDFDEMNAAIAATEDPLGTISKSAEAAKKAAKERSDATKQATADAKSREEEQRVQQEETYKQNKELLDTQISDIKINEEEKIRLIKQNGDSVKQQDDAILAEKIANSTAISVLLQKQLNDDRVALGAFNTEKRNFTQEELTAAKTSLTEIEKSAREHYKTLIALADEHKNKAIQAQKDIENLTKTSEEKIREIKRAGMSDEQVNADKELEIQQKTQQIKDLNSQGEFSKAAEVGKSLQDLTASQATAAEAESKKTGETYKADLALRKYQEAVELTKKSLAGLAEQEKTKSTQVEAAAAPVKATADTAAAQTKLVNEALQGGELKIVADIAPITAIKTELDKIPEVKTIIVKTIDEQGNPAFSHALDKNQASANQKASAVAVNSQVEITNIPNIQIDAQNISGLIDLMREQAILAFEEKIKLERRSGQ